MAARWGQTAAINRILDEVLLDREAAALLLKDNNPANRVALAGKAKLWMGNQAGTVADLIDGKNDDLKDAVMGARQQEESGACRLGRCTSIEMLGG